MDETRGDPAWVHPFPQQRLQQRMLCSVCPGWGRFEQRVENRMVSFDGSELGVCAGASKPRRDLLQVCCMDGVAPERGVFKAVLRIPAPREARIPVSTYTWLRWTETSRSYVPLYPS